MTRLCLPALLLLAVPVRSRGEVVSAEAARAQVVRADLAAVEITLPASTPLGEVLARIGKLPPKPLQLHGVASGRYRFRGVVPMEMFDQTLAALQDAAGDDMLFVVSPRVSERAIVALRDAALPSLFASARARAASMLREAGHQPGDVVAVVERRSWDSSAGALTLSLEVTVARTGLGGHEPTVSLALPNEPSPTGEYSVVASLRPNTPQTTGSQLAENLAKEGAAALKPASVESYGYPGVASSSSYIFLGTVPAASLSPLVEAVRRVDPDASVEATRDARWSGNGEAARRQADSLARLLGKRVGSLRATRPAPPFQRSGSFRVGTFSASISGQFRFQSSSSLPLQEGPETLYEFTLQDP